MMTGEFCAQTAGIWRVIGEIIYIIKIAIPILIVLLGSLDLGKAVIAGEDKKIKEAQKSFIMRLIYGIAVYFVFTIVRVIFGLLDVNIQSGDNKICWDCASKPHNNTCIKYVEQSQKSIGDISGNSSDSNDNYNTNSNKTVNANDPDKL